MNPKRKLLLTSLIVFLFVFGLILRVLFLPANTIDMKVFNLKWYDYIVAHGIQDAMGDEFANYTPPYLYLLSLATLTRTFIPSLTAIKLIPIIFDLFNASLVYQIVKTKFGSGIETWLAAALVWLLPTVVINGSFWGQVDALYTCFLLLSLLCILNEKPIGAILAFSVSFSIKAQAVFFLPFLALLFFKQKIRWQYFLLIPLVYFLMMLPAALAGRSLSSLALAYVTQGGTFTQASMNAATPYFLLPQSAYRMSLLAGIPLAGILLLIWVVYYGIKQYAISPKLIVASALLSLALTPYLLPKMHDRYFYPADVLSLVAVFFAPELWFVPIVYQMISLLSYSPFLFSADPQAVIPIALMMNTLVLGFLLWKQWSMVNTRVR